MAAASAIEDMGHRNRLSPGPSPVLSSLAASPDTFERRFCAFDIFDPEGADLPQRLSGNTPDLPSMDESQIKLHSIHDMLVKLCNHLEVPGINPCPGSNNSTPMPTIHSTTTYSTSSPIVKRDSVPMAIAASSRLSSEVRMGMKNTTLESDAPITTKSKKTKLGEGSLVPANGKEGMIRDFLKSPSESPFYAQSPKEYFERFLDDDIVHPQGSSGRGNELMDGYEKWQRFMLNPHSTIRMVHDLMSVLVLSFDVLGIPVYLAWSVDMDGWLKVASLASSFFWIWDVILTFNTGIYVRGALVMNRWTCGKRYVKSWFVPDVTIIAFDFFSLVSTSSKEGTGLLRMSKMPRFLRLARLLRLAKVSETFTRFTDLFASDSVDVLLDTAKPLIIIIVVNHLVACLWYAVGTVTPTDTDISWLDEQIGDGTTYAESSGLYQYTTSLHWSMTQMTPGSMQVFPNNSLERIVNFLCLLVGMMAFSSIISSLSAKLVQSQNRQKERVQHLSALRRFLRSSSVNPRFSVIIERAAVEALSSRSQKPVVVSDIHAVKLLPSSLQLRLRTELTKKHLQIPFFRMWGVIDDNGLSSFCHEAVECKSYAPDDLVFMSQTNCTQAFGIATGVISYNSNDYQTFCREGDFMCEPTLWMKWNHVGQALAKVGVSIVSVPADKFGSIVTRHRYFRIFALEYGKIFHQRTMQCLALNDEIGIEERPTDVKVSLAALDVLLPTMTSDTRLMIGALLLRAERERKHHLLWSRSDTDEQGLQTEVINGKCVLSLDFDKGKGEVVLVRVVAPHLIEVTDSDGKILTEIGAWTGERIQVDVKLPGKKQLGGENPETTVQRVLAEKLATLSEYVELTAMRLDVSDNTTSKRTSYPTKYLRTIHTARLREQIELVVASWEPGSSPGSMLRQPGSSGAKRNSRFSGRMSQMPSQTLEAVGVTVSGSAAVGGGPVAAQATLINVLQDLYAVADQKGDVSLYAWLDPKMCSELRSGVHDQALGYYFENAKLDQSVLRLARHRFEQAVAVSRMRWEAV